MYWDAFVGLKVLRDLMGPHPRVLVGFMGAKTKVQGYVDLEITFGDQRDKSFMIRYMVVNAPLTNNILIGRLSLNKLEAIMSRVHLKVKFPLEDRSVNTISVNQEISWKFNEESLKARKGFYGPAKQYEVHYAELDP